jgi:hypothetical protein
MFGRLSFPRGDLLKFRKLLYRSSEAAGSFDVFENGVFGMNESLVGVPFRSHIQAKKDGLLREASILVKGGVDDLGHLKNWLSARVKAARAILTV